MSRSRGQQSLGLLLALALTGCDFITDPAFPGEAQPFSPPAVYATWWEMTKSCAGLSLPFEDIKWFVIPESNHFIFSGDAVGGAWFRGRKSIVLVSEGVLEGQLVRHEMLHALLQDGGHPRAEFLNLCAGVVSCVGTCIREAGPAPRVPSSILHVSPSFLELAVSVQPATPKASILGGYFSVTVRARNPAATTVLVDLPPPGDDGPPASFSYRLFGPRGGFFYSDRAEDVSVRLFQPGETKIMVYDFFAGGEIRDGRLPIGEYSLEVAYGHRWLPKTTITLEP